ncbi:MAG: helix-turn-helix domain-containing protein, partial [Cetobacterium sp.]
MNNTIHNPTLRVLNVLEILSIHNHGLSLTEISNILHIPKGTLSP